MPEVISFGLNKQLQRTTPQLKSIVTKKKFNFWT